MRTRLLIILSCCLCYHTAMQAQSSVDTTAIIKTYNKVMSFANKPYVHYTTLSKMQAQPILEAKDTMQIIGEFFKADTDMYYKNGDEEVYIQDSFMVKINHNRKSILVAKLDKNAKEQLGKSTANMKPFNEAMRKQFIVSTSTLENGDSKLSLQSKIQPIQRPTSTTIDLVYSSDDLLPKSMTVVIKLSQPATEEVLGMIKEQGLKTSDLLQTIDGKQYVIRSQTVQSNFSNIQDTKEAVADMPKWTDCLQYDSTNKTFSAKAEAIKEYDISITF